MIGILDYGAGNVQAIARIYDNLNIQHKRVRVESEFEDVSKIVLPGVGSFDAVMAKLNQSGLKNRLSSLVLNESTPVLGICVGLQIMGNTSEEGILPGLGWVNATVKKFDASSSLFVPHMGWNTVNIDGINPIFSGADDEFGYYFVHSFYFDLHEEVDSTAKTNYGIDFVSAIKKGNIFATQFHPEKSHSNGVLMLRKFAELSSC